MELFGQLPLHSRDTAAALVALAPAAAALTPAAPLLEQVQEIGAQPQHSVLKKEERVCGLGFRVIQGNCLYLYLRK